MNDFEIVYHPKFERLHKLNYLKPDFEVYENPLRCKIPMSYLISKKLIHPQFYKNNQYIWESPDRKLSIVKPKPLKEQDIELIHTINHIERVKFFSRVGSGQVGNLVLATPDIWEIAKLSAGAVYRALSDVLNGRTKVAFSFNRPPGHHAIAEESDGLCVFNNLAIAIAKARKDLSFQGRIAILDIDDHFGDGVSKIFYEDPKVLYASIHEYTYDQGGEGSGTQMGARRGIGTNFEFPVPIDAGDGFMRLYIESVSNVLKEYSPDLLVVALGLDGHWGDPLGNLNFTMKAYFDFFVWIKEIAQKYTQGKIVIEFEGGYNYYTIARALEMMIEVFAPLKQKMREKYRANKTPDSILYDNFAREIFASDKDPLKIFPGMGKILHSLKKRENEIIKLIKNNPFIFRDS